MGIVCSCLASTFLLVGEIFSTLFLAVGEVGAILLRGVFALIVGLCDVLAACACCCQVPWSERPDRGGYTYSTIALRDGAPAQRLADKPKFSARAFAKPTAKTLLVLPSSIGGKKRKQAARKSDASSTDAKQSSESEELAEKEPVEEAKPAAVAPQASQGWFGAWFGGSTPAPAPATTPATVSS